MSVCVVVLNGTSVLPVTIRLDTIGDTAEGKRTLLTLKKYGFDYVGNDFGDPEQSELLLGAGISSVCTSIETNGDDIYENDETFFVTLAPNNSDVAIINSTAIVLIQDNDGECLLSTEHFMLTHTSTVGVEVNWAQGSYVGVEGGVVSVCATKLQQTQRGFDVTIIAPDNPGPPVK